MRVWRTCVRLVAVMVLVGATVVSGHCAPATSAGPSANTSWKDTLHRAILRNSAVEASFQAGMLYSLKDLATGEQLISADPSTLPAKRIVFDEVPTDLDSCRVSQRKSGTAVTTQFTAPNGDKWETRWSLLPGKGDLVLDMKGMPARPVEQMRAVFPACDIAKHRVVTVDVFGVARPASAPWTGMFVGDPEKHGSPLTFVQPLVALFEGDRAGWFLEGRDPKVGPSNVLVQGHGQTATVGMVRRFPIFTRTPELYQVRFRTYKDRWENAVDPYVAWMEKGAGYVPLEKKSPAWLKNIKVLSYVEIGDYENLEALAKRLDPKTTLISRLIGYRYHGIDAYYPDYRVREDAKKWLRRAHELGFHVALWYNSKSVSVTMAELVEKFKPGFQVIGTDANGKPKYESIYDGPNEMIRVSAAYKPFRDYMVAQMKDAVDSGVDVIYLDEAMCANGKFVVDGVNGNEGMMMFMKQILDTYPGVAIQTEQFNTLTAKYAGISLSQMPLGHELSGYIFRKYVKIVPEGVMFSPAENPTMDAFASWGYMLPGANPQYRESDVEIAQAFQKYDLVPDSRLPHHHFTQYVSHYSQGITPVDDTPLPAEGLKLFGYRGKGGTTAYFEKHPHERGLVVYEPGKEPQWFGARHSGLTSWEGPGLPVYFYFRHTVRDWLIYDGDKLMGLDPKETFWFDKSLKPSPTRFHVTKIPADFAGVIDSDKRIPPQEIGQDDSFFELMFTAHGEMGLYVPDGYDAYLDGEKIAVDAASHTATIQAGVVKTPSRKREGTGYVVGNTTVELSPTAENPHRLTVVKRVDQELSGPWARLPWKPTLDSLTQVAAHGETDFVTTVGGVGRINGRLPNAKSLRLVGTYQMIEDGPGPPGDGIVRVNGREVMRIPHGERPYKPSEFDVDISKYAGQYVLFEFISDGWPGRNSSAEWLNPRIVAKP